MQSFGKQIVAEYHTNNAYTRHPKAWACVAAALLVLSAVQF